MIVTLKSFKYKDILLEGPDVIISLLEEEWARDNHGTVLDFAEWLINHKGFKRYNVNSVEYKFKRG